VKEQEKEEYSAWAHLMNDEKNVITYRLKNRTKGSIGLLVYISITAERSAEP
jgi:hypothetical protein